MPPDLVRAPRVPRPARNARDAVRLAALERYDILDSPPEPVYDDIVRVAAAVLGTPVAAVTLVAGDRVHLMAATGLGLPQLRPEESFCFQAIRRPDQVMVVEDLAADARFVRHPLVTGPPYLRFYAGAPLCTADGQALGALCVMDTRTRAVSSAQTQSLQALARLVMRHIELRGALGVLAVAFAGQQRPAALRDCRHRFRLAFDEASVGMTLATPDGRLLEVNARFAALVGRDQHSLAGTDQRELLHADQHAGEQRILQHLRSEDAHPLVREQRFRRPDGSAVWALTTTSVVRGPDGAARYLVSQVEEVTSRTLAEQALQQTRVVAEAIVSTDAEGRITAWNPGAARMFGLRQDQVIGRPMTDMIPDRHRPTYLRAFTDMVEGAAPSYLDRPLEIEALRHTGEGFPAELSIARTQRDGRVSLTAIIRDVTARRSSQNAELRPAGFVELLHAVAVAANRATTVSEAYVAALDQVCTLTGWQAGHVWQRGGDGTLHSSSRWWLKDPQVLAPLVAAAEGARLAVGEDLPGTAVAARAPVWISGDDVPRSSRLLVASELGLPSVLAVPVLAGGQVEAVLEFLGSAEPDEALLDAMGQVGTHLGHVLERERAERRLEYQALHDPLTGMANRTLLLDRVDRALSSAALRGASVGVLFVDLDRFKLVNDSLGHHAGDQLLVEASRRIERAVRAQDLVARFGGDEFVVLCEDVNGRVEACRIAERIVAAFQEPFRLAEREAFVAVSVGVAVGGECSDQAEALVRDADSAMHRAKEAGRNRCEVYDEAMRSDAIRRLDTSNALHRALERGEFTLVYLPVVRLASGGVEGVEALLRWEHPQRGPIGPREFIPLLEEAGLIGLVGRWVLEQSCRQVRRWEEEAGRRLRMSVNLSARQLRRPDLVEAVHGALRGAELDPSRLTLEIRESGYVNDLDVMLPRLEALRRLGVSLAIDDFGTGYSSLSHLHQLPVDLIKVDRTFVEVIDAIDDDVPILNAILEMGRALDLEVLAEGVETPAQAVYLHAHDCQLAQGSLFSGPLPADRVTAWIDAAEERGHRARARGA